MVGEAMPMTTPHGVKASLDSVVALAEGGELVVTINENVLACHEVRISLHTRETVQEGEHGIQEGLLLLNRTARAKLVHESIK